MAQKQQIHLIETVAEQYGVDVPFLEKWAEENDVLRIDSAFVFRAGDLAALEDDLGSDDEEEEGEEDDDDGEEEE